MAEYVLQGKKGSGKGIIAVGMIKERLESGRPVATNLNLFMEYLLSPASKNTNVFRVPDQPTIHDLEALGTIDTGGDEDKNGLLVLDECANWLNTRDYRDGNRKNILDWFLHSRKFGWDVIYIIQDIGMLDKQWRDGFAEHVITALRADRLPIPLFGSVMRLFGMVGKLPKFHVGVVRYGQSPLAPVVERKIFRGTPFYRAYDTLQRFTPNNQYAGVSCALSGWHVAGRFMTWWQMNKSSLLSGFFAGAISAFFVIVVGGYFLGFRPPAVATSIPVAQQKITGFYQDGPRVVVFLDDGSSIDSRTYSLGKSGLKVTYQGKVYTEKGQE